jgi:ComF family protein
LREAIHLFKYQKKTALGKRLTRHLSGFLPPIPPADGLVPVPLHPKRLRHREFNQSLIIARTLGQIYRLPLLPDLLLRVRPTSPQVELHRKDRAGNVRGAFQIRRGVPDLEGKHLILVDDVLTTGATVNECARILKKAGVEKVYVVTLARTSGP